jgi:cell division protein FtsI (penicillin-binding protein 3)
MHNEFRKKSNRQIRSFYKETGKRGRIVAASGEDLAYDTYESDLIIDPKRFVDYEYGEEMLEYLKKYRKIDVNEELKNIKTMKSKRYYKLITNLSSNERSDIEKKMKELLVNKNEIFFEKRNKRVYNSEEMMRPIVGYMGYSSEDPSRLVGRFGIENSYEKILNPNVINVERYLSGNRKREIPLANYNKDKLEKKEKNGHSVVLTIDYVIQYIIYSEVKEFFEEYKPNWMAAVMLEPNTGEIMSMVSLPEQKKAYSRNNIIQNRYEPGSVFKPLIVAAALEDKFIDEDDIFKNPEGRISKYGITIRDSSWRSVGNLTANDILVRSSNVGMVKIGEKIPSDIFEYYLRKFGLYEKTGIEFPGEPYIPQESYEKWDGLRKYSMSFGQALAITPLQMAMSFAACINGGKLWKPQLVKEVINEEGEVISKIEPEFKNNVISEETSAKIREMLRNVVLTGTGRQAKIDGYDIGGKTGTSQKSEGGAYAKDKFVISFAGFYPVEKPEYLLLIIADAPQTEDGKSYGGGSMMAPLFKEIMSRLFKYKNILPQDVDMITLDKDKEISDRKIMFEMNKMPELTNLSAREVIRVFNDTDIELEIVGRGMVYKQEPDFGSEMSKVKKVKVYLEE